MFSDTIEEIRTREAKQEANSCRAKSRLLANVVYRRTEDLTLFVLRFPESYGDGFWPARGRRARKLEKASRRKDCRSAK